jgi:hypothetical protein
MNHNKENADAPSDVSTPEVFRDPLVDVALKALQLFATWKAPTSEESIQVRNGDAVYGNFTAHVKSADNTSAKIAIFSMIDDVAKEHVITCYGQINAASVEVGHGKDAQVRKSFLQTWDRIMKSIATRRDVRWVLLSENGTAVIASVNGKVMRACMISAEHDNSQTIRIEWVRINMGNKTVREVVNLAGAVCKVQRWCAYVSGCVYTGRDEKSALTVVMPEKESKERKQCSCIAVCETLRAVASKEDVLVALCMGQHARLGGISPLSWIDQSVFMLIIANFLVLLDGCGCNSVYDAWRSLDLANRVK